jgi:hypothetical protein
VSVAELKVQAEALSTDEVHELARYLRALALRKNPARAASLKAALDNPAWVSQTELEAALAELEQSGK